MTETSGPEKQTWYVICRYSTPPRIEPIVVLKETEYTVTVEEGQHKRVTRRNKGGNIFRTKAGAEAEVTMRLSKAYDRAKEQLERARTAFEKWFMRA